MQPGALREKDFLTDSDSKRKASKVVKPVRSRTYSSKDASTPADIALSVSGVVHKPELSQSQTTYYKKEDLIVFDSDEEEEDGPHEPVQGREVTKSLAELEQLFFRCANVMKAEDIHLQMRNLHLIMAKQILKDMEYQIKYEEKHTASREMWDFKQKVHTATFRRIAHPIEKAVEKKKKEKEKNSFVPRWMPDERRPRCLLCKRSFGVFNRRHHCRACGDITCNDCSKMEGPHKIRRCHECIRLGRTVAPSMAPAKSSPPTPASFSSTNGPSHPSHKRTTYIHQQNSSPPSTVTNNRDLGGHLPLVSLTSRPSMPSVRPTPTASSSASSASGTGRRVAPGEHFTFPSASIAGPQNTSFSVPIAWGASSEFETSKVSVIKPNREHSASLSSASSGRSRSNTPVSTPQNKSSTSAASTATDPQTLTTGGISSVVTMCNGTRPHSKSVASVPWVPDEHRLCCVICGGTFHFFFRRHHCRKCGEVVCNTCSTVENTPSGERYCESCREEAGITIEI